MLGTLGEEDKLKWSEWVPTMTHAYNSTKCQVTGFTPYFLMFGGNLFFHRPGVWHIQPYVGRQFTRNLCQKVRQRLQWAYKVANECIQKESLRHKKYYDKKMRCMKLDINDIVLVRVKAFGNDRKVADKWEEHPYQVVEQLPNRPVFKVQNLNDMSKFRTLHRNMFVSIENSTRG